MINRKILFTIILCILCCGNILAKKDYDVYLLIGQSNAVGFAPLEEGDENPVEGCYLLDSEGNIVPLGGVVNRYSSLPKLGNRMGYSLGVSFAKRMHETTGRKILIVSNAKGNTSIGQWLPTAKDPLFYNEAVRRAKQARKYGTIKGILWHQGCGDLRWAKHYTKNAQLLFSSLREDLGNDKIPVVVGEIGHWMKPKGEDITAEVINEVLRSLPSSIPYLECVTSEGCDPIYDKIHFNHKALETLGERYAEKMISLSKAPARNKAGLELTPKNINKIVKAMTLDEKCHFVIGNGQIDIADSTELVILGDCRRIVPGCAGTSYPIERLGIPAIVLADGPAGLRIDPTRKGDKNTYYCTGFPIGTLLSSTWDDKAVEKVGAAMGQEVLEYGVDVLLAPGSNIHRNPLCGRNFEYFSEDPLLSGTTAAAYINGIQSNGVGTSLKHFALNNSEINRLFSDSRVSSRALREIYLKNFEIALKKSSPWTVMSSYNYLNGIYTSENKELLETILRKEFGFEGMVMSDWGGGRRPVAQIKAGNDMIQPGRGWMVRTIKEAVENGTLDETELDACVRRILELIVKTPRYQGYKFSNKPALDAHAKVSREVAAEGMVLLKNDAQTLPFNSGSTVALFGTGSYKLLAGGWGSGDVNKAYSVNLDEGLCNAGIKLDKTTNEAYQAFCSTELPRVEEINAHANFCGFHWIPEEMDASESAKLAATAAHNANHALITICRNSGEGTDRMIKDDFCLKASEIQLIKDVCDAFHSHGKKVSVVLNIGGVVETASWKNLPDAILVAWHPGQEAGNAIADVLTGRVNPSGRLPMSFPASYTDVPSQNFPMLEAITGKNDSFIRKSVNKLYDVKDIDYIDYTEDIYVGYRHYSTSGVEVSYPFGYGLSYTEFSIGDIKTSKDKDGWNIQLSVSNTGHVAGSYVAEIYCLGNSACSIPAPKRQLKAYAKTRVLNPGEKQELNMHIEAMDLASFDENTNSWKLYKGDYTMMVASDASAEGLTFPIHVAKNKEKSVGKVLIPTTENGIVPDGQVFIYSH